MRLFNGKEASDKILKELKTAILREDLKPRLAVILVGEDEASKIYIRLKKKAAEEIGIGFELYKYDITLASSEVIKKINELNKREEINGIIVQLPLPASWSRDEIIGAIDPLKDVDGFHEKNRRLLLEGKPVFEPILPTAMLVAIKAALGDDLSGKKAAALVNSDIFGQVLRVVLEKEGIKFDYIVRNICSADGTEEKLREVDVVITACGCPNLVNSEMIKDGAVVIDGGIYRFKDGRVCGDVDCVSVQKKASFLTPVPGGLGPLVIALLLRSVYLAAKSRAVLRSESGAGAKNNKLNKAM